MNENEWAESICKLISSINLSFPGDHDDVEVKVETLRKLPYASEIIEYDNNFIALKQDNVKFETDLLIYEKKENIIKPRIIIEAKLSRISTHDAITYSYKAQNHKNITPFIRYGIIIGKRKHFPLPGRLFRHGSNFDFMMSFIGEDPTIEEKETFTNMIKKELRYSRQFEEMLTNSRSSNRKRYYVMQKELRLEELSQVTNAELNTKIQD